MYSRTLKWSAFVGCLLLSATSARSLDGELLALASATSTTADVTILSDSKEPAHTFHVKFRNDIGESKYCEMKDSGVCVEWADSSRLTVRGKSNGQLRVNVDSKTPMTVCFDIKGQHLYGGPIVNKYPAERANISNLAYMTGDMTRYGVVLAVTERYWYTSTGVNMKVDPTSPIFLSQNENELCFAVDNKYPYSPDVSLSFSYSTCPNSKNLRDGVRCFFPVYDKPIPPEKVIGSPIWSTWVEFKRDVTQEKSIEFFNKIKSHNLKLSVMEIDDAWETCYGSEEFDKSKFPDAKAMVDLFHSEGYLATLWVHPFIGPGCPSLSEYEPYLAKFPNGSIGITEWWNGKGAAIINFTDPNAINWFEQRLFKIQKTYEFDSFKFDAGEAAYLPGLGKDERTLTLKQPNLYTTNYVKAASKFGTLAEVRVGSESYDFKLMQRLQDTNSVWDAENWGLRSVLLSVLQLSLHGYGAILPDMIGGNCYGNQPTKELFIRWIQLNTFLPVIQFSLAPWYFDDETVDLTRTFTDLHYQYKDRILKEFNDSSHPVINPIWWIAPDDPVAQTIDSEFLLGEDLLVAPVLEEGAVSRDIYLPEGQWKDVNTGEVHSGPGYIKNYSAPLNLLPYFERIRN